MTQHAPAADAARTPRPALLRRLPLIVIPAMLAAGVSVVAGPAGSASAQPVPIPSAAATAEALPTPQTDGIVFSVAIVGNTAYAGGRFTKARPAGAAAGTQEVTRNNLLAFDLTTGALLPWAPSVTGTTFTSTTAPDAFCTKLATANTYNCNTVFRIKATPDGSRIYVGGDFSAVDGVGRNRIAAFDTATGALNTAFHPALNSRVRGLAVTDSTVYVGGDFTSSDGTARTRLAAYTPAGQLLPWAPTADKMVWSMAAGGGKILIGGNFDSVNGTRIHGLEALDAGTGAIASNWAYSSMPSQSIPTDIVTDSSGAYVSAYNFGGANGADRFEGRMALELATGTVRWTDGCYGDTQSLAVANGLVYSASHSHDCSLMNGHPQTNPTTYQRMLAETTTVQSVNQGGSTTLVPRGAGIPALAQWFPKADGGPSTSAWKNGPWAVAASDNYVVYGGEFLTVNGQAQQSLVRFATPASSQRAAPVAFTRPTATRQADGSVRVSFTATYDYDDPTIRYDLYRDDKADPVASTTLSTSFFTLSAQTLTDRTLPAGQSALYRVKAVDPSGRAASTNWTTTAVTGTAVPAQSRYSTAVLSDGPINYWRLGETSGSTFRDTAGGDDLTVRASVTQNQTGAFADDTNKAALFSTGGFFGTTKSLASTSTSRYAPDVFTVETWIRTSSTKGGQIIGWSSGTGGQNSTSDRKVYMTNAGQLVFGVSPNTKVTIQSPASYNDNQWHLVQASLSTDGMKLFVDGSQVAANASVKEGQFVRSGYWRLGDDTLSGWPSAPSDSVLNGTVDEGAVYGSALTAAQVSRHYAARTTSAPVAAFTQSCTGRVCTFDASGSTSTNGAISSYAWDFGDGTTGTGVKPPAHTYTTDGARTVKLTITDAANLTASTTQTVTVSGAAPTAAFTSTCAQAACTFDGSTSTPGSAAISTYAWDFGDTSTGSGQTVQHAYAQPGTYTVSLTVTDADGRTNTKTSTVTASADSTLATDTFARTTTNGWGTADKGGSWTVSGTAANFAVSGGAGAMTVPSAGANRYAVLGATNAADSDLTVGLSLDKLPAAGSTYLYGIARQTAANTDYRARIQVSPAGAATLQIVRRAGTTSDVAVGAAVPVSGLTVAAGGRLNVRFQVTGSAPTTLKAEVWADGSAEPADWQVVRTDTTDGLQTSGNPGVGFTSSASNTGVPVVLSVRAFALRQP